MYAARDHVFATIEENHRAEKGDFDAALGLWQADRVDPAALATLRAHHLAAAKKTGDAVVQALADAHDALTAAQRAEARRTFCARIGRPWTRSRWTAPSRG